ncbi:transcriptional repressor LexA [Yunchengibacter salinarum]|uniref:transcriptional repressor LexA n=1 Tax=Yunchengibacter salinarum TaxID=3133399 RepID=UPI0035B5BDC9
MLTSKQHQLLMFIHRRLSEKGVSPSFDEMKDALGLKSKSGVHRLIKALEERGFIRRLPNRARALEVLHLPDSRNPTGTEPVTSSPSVAIPTDAPVTGKAANDGMVNIPLHGRIAAGTPIEALENPDSQLSVPQGMVGRSPCYALDVSGDSMVEMGILDGDTVIIEKCDTAPDGTVVVALVDGEEATLKTLKRQGRHVALIPANRAFDTQILEADRVHVQGRLRGLMRRYH